MKRIVECPIPAGACESVGDFLKQAYAVSTRQIRSFRDNGNLLMDGKPVGMRESIRGHRQLTLCWETEEEASVQPNDLPVGIVYEDADILVVDKPAGMPTHPSQDHETDTLAGAVTGHWLRNGESHRFRPIGRLDRETSGLMVIGKSAWAALMLEQQQKNHRMYRCYTALVEGNLTHMRGTVMAPIDRKPGSIILRQVSPKGQLAVTDYEVKVLFEQYAGIELRLTTGRTHQIRVHMASIGHPLLHDGLYGSEPNPDGHLALRSTELYLVHPVSNVPMRWSIQPIWNNV